MLKKLRQFLGESIWDTSREGNGKGRATFSALRLISLVSTGMVRNRLPGHAAALCYYTLIGLGPLIAIAVMISSFVFQGEGEDLASKTLHKAMGFISAPAAISTEESETGEPSQGEVLNPDIVNFIDQLVSSARSGAVGLVGSLFLIVISIQLFVSIENTLNAIWGVRQGRSLFRRLVFYWTLISLGAVLGFASAAMLSASRLEVLQQSDWLPDWVVDLAQIFAPSVSVLAIIILLLVFYYFMPNTRVRLGAALAGALVATGLLALNKELSFLYVSRVIREQSLYGSIGILPVLMFGLYVFWLLVLLGGQVTYAVQNMRFLTSLRAWENLSERSREALELCALLAICRRFEAASQPIDAETLARDLDVPINLLNQSLSRLCDAGLVSELSAADVEDEHLHCYQPALPPNQITFGQFKLRMESIGNERRAQSLGKREPATARYLQRLRALYAEDPTLSRPLTEWLPMPSGAED